jgi:ATP-binding cassette subfamily C protein CydC
MSSTFLRVVKLARPITGWLLLATGIGAATVVSGICLMTTSAYLISEAALHPSIAVLGVAIVGVRFFGIARGLLRYVERLVTHSATFRLLAWLRVWLYTALEPLAPAGLLQGVHATDAGYSSGDLLSRIVSDIETMQNFYVRVLAPPLVAALVGIGMWLFFGAFDATLAFIFLGFFLLSAAGIPLFTYLLSQRIGAQLIASRAALHTHIVDSLQGMADTLAFGQEEQQTVRASALNQQYVTAQASLASIGGLQEALGSLLMNGTALVMLVMAIPLVRSGLLNGVFLAVLVLGALASFEAVLPLPLAFQQLSSSLAAARRLFALVDAEPAVRDLAQPAALPLHHDLVLDSLCFRYDGSEPYVLNDVSLRLAEGRCVALVGPSGAGKSTIAHLLLRFWNYEEGHILLGGHELRDLSQDEVRALFGVVTQDTHLFNTTIRQNLMLARKDASEEEMVQAARQAQLHEFIMSLPRGYDTEIGEQGLRLSGGERQRQALARALLKNAPLLILDEPTANLDAVTARAIMQELRVFMRGRTTLLITHRLADLELADEVLLLEHGHVVTCSSCDGLLDQLMPQWSGAVVL